ncbi:transcriptional repressor, putative [Rhizoctonia solani AG-3 Rhs1AP]|uniref:Transcriptional repressor, putative n=1 Tax=Rhizoctonia solani AG-3 Rhs1AP TaxID=1086054 RepID=X8JC36_9AGAM|nr:transcriptional repressor, putative [Rhizoctonia solani AG-3 Rhs1AP]
MNFFKAKQRTPSEIVRGLRDAINKLDVGPPGSETRRKASEDVTKGLQQVKGLLHGDGDPGPELVAQLATEAYAADLLPAIVKSCAKFDFEARKDAAQVFSLLLRRQIGSRSPTVEYIVTREIVVYDALKGYEIEEVALSTGLILREMLKHEPIARILLNSDQFYSFPHYIEDTTFGVSCDAFANLKETLTRHKPNGRRISRGKLRPILYDVHIPPTVHKLRDKTSISQTSRRDIAGPRELQCHDALYWCRGES